MSEPEEFLASPRWKQAVRDFLAEGFKYGDIVSIVWLDEHFGLEPLADDAPTTMDEVRDRQFKRLQYVEALKRELLEEHQIYLASVFGQGYRVTPPAEQTGIVTEKFENDAKRAFRKAAVRLKNVRLDELDANQRRENMDAISRLSMLRGMQKSLE